MWQPGFCAGPRQWPMARFSVSVTMVNGRIQCWFCVEFNGETLELLQIIVEKKVERCKGRDELFKAGGLHEDMSQQDSRFLFSDGYLISMKPYPKGLIRWLLGPPGHRSHVLPLQDAGAERICRNAKRCIELNYENTAIEKILGIARDLMAPYVLREKAPEMPDK